MSKPCLATIKTLFAHSCNRCAFPRCDRRLTDPQWNGVQADMAHIRGEKPGSARYAPDMTDAERNSIDNLMLLCPNHHREIDKLRPQIPQSMMRATYEAFASRSLNSKTSSPSASQRADDEAKP